MARVLIFLLTLLVETGVLAQNTPATGRDTVITADSTSAADLLAGLSETTESQPLLPANMVFTQRALWGQKGLLRVTGLAPLTAAKRERELKLRRTMLKTHQILGFATLGGMIAQGIVGSRLYKAKGPDYVKLRDTHEDIATFINVAYGTTALLSLTAPPPLVGQRRGINSIKVHRALAIVHLTGMIATNMLARRISGNAELKPYHRAAAFTTFGAYAASIIAIKF
ncbi:hypothetical protein GCM10023189_54960 [Nibrella saemangeumensis]|uniref:Cytochrome b561 domain-containing protein n=1 Tax=Nibrella saemangeumensis TaxID=1084526 RepID=A0ABP8NL47_9BACT